MSEPVPSPDWATRAADSIERVVVTVRDRTTRPLLLAGRAIVFGLLIAIVGVTMVVLLSVAIFRIVVILTDRAWVAYLILGAIFVIVGFILMALREGAVEEAT